MVPAPGRRDGRPLTSGAATQTAAAMIGHVVGRWRLLGAVTFPAGEFPSPPPMNMTLSPALFEGVEVP